MKIFKFCSKYLKKYQLKLVIYVFIGLLTTLIGIITTYLIGIFLDTLVMAGARQDVFNFALFFISLNILKVLLGYLSTLLYIKMQINMGNELNVDAISHVQKLSLSFINQTDTSYLNQSVNNDSNELVIFCITIIQNVVINIVMLVAPFIILLSMNIMIAIILLIFIVAYIFIYRAFKKPLHEASFLFRESQSHFFASLYEQFQYIKLIKINGVQTEINQRLHKSFDDLKTTALKDQKINYLFSSLDQFIGIGAQMVLFIIGGLQVLNGNFTIGMFTVFSIYFNMMLSSARYFFNLGAIYQSKLVSFERLNQIFEQMVETVGNEIIDSIENIVLDQVNFAYGDKVVIQQADMSFEKGKLYVISGSNGKGKSTLINLLLGMYIDEKQGNILYNGENIKLLDMVTLRKELIGFSEQETSLVQDTIKYNLTFGKDVDEEKLSFYLELLNMHEFIGELESGIGSFINEKNTNISGGEKQKISILKVLLKQPDLMIFDEPSSALDAQTTEKFINHLSSIKQDKMIILITHDSDIKACADVVIEL